MKRKAALFLAAIMTMGTVSTALAEEIFSDINNVPWGGAQAYINSVYKNGLMIGDMNDKGERVFRAKDNISYNETVQLVYKLSGKTADDITINKWAEEMRKNNIPKWAYEAVSYALENNIITRANLSTFMNFDGSNRNATREDTAYIFGRFLENIGKEEKPGTKEFSDNNKISAVCQKYVNILAGLDIIVGDENGNFNPNNTVNRAEMAVIATKTNNILNDMVNEHVVDNTKPESNYSGYINQVTDTSLMIFTYDGNNKTLDRVWNTQYYLDGKEINSRGIQTLVENGIILKADVYVNSSDVATDIYCTKANVEGQITGLNFKSGEYKRGSRYIPYAFYTVTISYTNGLSRSYRIDLDTDLYYDDKEIDMEDFQELVGKSFPKVDKDDENVIDSGLVIIEPAEIEEDNEKKYLNVYGVADVDYNSEYYVYPQARIEKLELHLIKHEKAIISKVNNNSIVVLDDNGREFEYNISDNARFYVNGDKVRPSEFKKKVKLGLTTVEIKYDSNGYVTKLSAEVNN